MKTTELIGHAQTLALNADLALKRAERAGLDVEEERARLHAELEGLMRSASDIEARVAARRVLQ